MEETADRDLWANGRLPRWKRFASVDDGVSRGLFLR